MESIDAYIPTKVSPNNFNLLRSQEKEMEEIFHILLIFITITIIRTVKIWNSIMYIMLHFFDIYIGIVVATKYDFHKN